MPIADRFRLWVRALLGRRRVEHDLDREMRFHLEMEIEQRIRDGLSPADARRAALIAFGGVEQHKEAVRDERGTRFIEELIADVRLALRSFRARPAFVATAAITMAFGIGAATAVFSVANGVFYRPVSGVHASREVVRVDLHRDSDGGSISPSGISYPNLLDLEGAIPALPALAATADLSLQISSAGASARSVRANAVAGDYFGILGVRAQIGRLFDADERTPAAGAHVAVISDRLWRSTFGANARVVGQTMRANGVSLAVIGVAPAGFLGIDRIGDVDVWVPVGVFRELGHFRTFDLTDRRTNFLRDIVGRLTPGTRVSVAQAQIRASLERLVAAFPVENKNVDAKIAYVTPDVGLVGFRRAWMIGTVRLLAIVATIVLVVSCASTANLLLVRGIRRRGELAVRRALGASVGRIVRQQVAEGVTLALFGCVAGVAVTFGFRVLLGNEEIGVLPPVGSLPVDWRVLAFAIGLSLTAGVVFALVPALMSSRSNLLDSLGDTARSTSGRTLRLRDALTVVQIASAMALVVCAILLTRSIRSLRGVDVGFDVDRTSVFSIDPAPQGYDAARIVDFRLRLTDALRSTPGIDGVALASVAPFLSGMHTVDLHADGYAGTDWQLQAHSFSVDASYFKTLRIPLVSGSLAGWELASGDTSARQIVVSRLLAQRLFGAADPVGRAIVQRVYRGTKTYTVVAVAADVRTSGLRGEVVPTIYTPFGGTSPFGSVVVVHSSHQSDAIQRLVERATATVDPSVPVERSWTMSASVAQSIAAERLFERLVGTLAVISALLAAAGLYGIIAYSVAERTKEIGIRMALGSSARDVVRLVTRRIVVMVAAGLAIGVVGSIWLSRLMASKLFGVTPLDPSSYASAAAAMIVLGILASASPARLATRVNPVDALRHE